MLRRIAPLALAPFVLVAMASAAGALLSSSCATTQAVSPSVTPGEVHVVLRRVDVVQGGYDQLQVNAIVAVENGTALDLDLQADARLSILGESTGDDDSAAPPPADDAGDDTTGGGDDDGASALDEPARPVAAGKSFAGSGHGAAKAGQVSELPIAITIALPSDAAELEQIFGWKRMRVHVEGAVGAGVIKTSFAGDRDVAPPRLPELKLKSAQVAKVDDGAAGEAYFTMLVQNPNTFDVNVDRVAWRIQIKDKELKEAGEGAAADIPATSVEELNETIPLDDKHFPGKELKALLKQPSIPYVIDGFFEIRGIHKDFHFTGDMNFPR